MKFLTEGFPFTEASINKGFFNMYLPPAREEQNC